MNKLITIVLLVLSRCASQPSQVYPSSVRFFDYNSISESYTDMPTSARIDTGFHGEKYLMYASDRYTFSNGSQNSFVLDISKETGNQVISLIDKYLKWEGMAVKDGDEFDKEIGKAKEAILGNTYEFSFHSGNKKHHYLSISMCSVMCTSAGYLDKKNAIALKNEISAFVTDTYHVADTSKYQ